MRRVGVVTIPLRELPRVRYVVTTRRAPRADVKELVAALACARRKRLARPGVDFLWMRNRKVVGLACIIAAAACGGGANGGKEAKAPAITAGVCRAGSSNARPIGKTGKGSTIALARIGERRAMLVADEDAKAVLTLDLDTHASLAMTPLGATPGQLYVAKDGRVVVTLRDKNEIAILTASQATAPLTRACTGTTPTEPIAIAATPDVRRHRGMGPRAHRLRRQDARGEDDRVAAARASRRRRRG